VSSKLALFTISLLFIRFAAIQLKGPGHTALGSQVTVGHHFLCTVVKAGIWMGWIGWTGWSTGFFLTSEWVFTVGRSWFLLMICKASWVLPIKHLPVKTKHTTLSTAQSGDCVRILWGRQNPQLYTETMQSVHARNSTLYFVVWGFELRAFTLSHSASSFCVRYFQDRVLWTICLGWPQTAILLISAS
jgi:hypothetical protein